MVGFPSNKKIAGELHLRLRSVASVALGLWFLAVKACLTLALEAIHATLVGRRRTGDNAAAVLSPSSHERSRNNSGSGRRRVRARRSSGEASRTGSEEDESGGVNGGVDNTIYHSKTIKLRYRSSLRKRKEQVGSIASGLAK